MNEVKSASIEFLEIAQFPNDFLGLHKIQDYKSLIVHQAAVVYCKQYPAAIQKALSTLDRWDRQRLGHESPLHNHWRRILIERDWDLAISTCEFGNQLRQASPLAVLLPDATKSAIDIHIQQVTDELRRRTS